MTEEQRQAYNRYLNKGFTDDQLLEIRLGIESGYDVSAYAMLNIQAKEMMHIRKWMNEQASIVRQSQIEELQKEYLDQEAIPVAIDKKEEQKDIFFPSVIIGSLSIVFGIIALIAFH